MIGRSGSEGADLTSYEEGDYLELSKNEQDLLESARAGFDKLIVVVDSGNAMQMGWVDEYDVDAVIWSGLPGPYSFEALGQILNGTVNPSGKLPDTWVYDSNPANENFGEQAADNAQDRYYVDYVEGIYVGYKWYETACAEEAVDEAVTREYVEGTDYAAEGDLTLEDLKGAEYDDERWEQLISQMTFEELLALAGNTIYSLPAVKSIDKQATTDSDGPLGISSMFMTDLVTVAFPCVPILTATFNKELAHEMESCVSDQAATNSITAWYAPAMDTHRSE